MDASHALIGVCNPVCCGRFPGFLGLQARLVPARNPNGNSELAPQESNYKFSGKETACKDFGPVDAVIVNNTCEGCVDKTKVQRSPHA